MDDLVSYRIENVTGKTGIVKDTAGCRTRHYKDSIGRSYYSIFTGVRAGERWD